MDKTCTACGKTKPEDSFPVFWAHGRQYRRSKCKPCWKPSSRTKAYRQGERARAAKRQGKLYIPGKAGRRKANTVSQLQVMLCMEAHRAHTRWLRRVASDAEVRAFYADRPWANPRISDAEKYRLQYANDQAYQLAERMRRQVTKAKKRDGIGDVMREAIKRGGQSNKVERELGYTIEDLRQHLEARFTKGMDWEAFARGEIHIDHIRPQASFDLTDPEQWRECWSLANLQPLWWPDNLRKGKRLDWAA
jgi:hypothetical protein